MSCYVDPQMDFGWRLGPSCHLWADTLEELHAMADKIGLKRKWFQDKPTLQHYDLTVSRRKLAIENGAIELDRKAFDFILTLLDEDKVEKAKVIQNNCRSQVRHKFPEKA